MNEGKEGKFYDTVLTQYVTHDTVVSQYSCRMMQYLKDKKIIQHIM